VAREAQVRQVCYGRHNNSQRSTRRTVAASRRRAMPQDHWLPGFNFNEEWFDGDRYDTLTICRTLDLARAAFAVAIAEKPGRFMIRNRIRVVKRHPEGDW
jgi:hypothetical protein